MAEGPPRPPRSYQMSVPQGSSLPPRSLALWADIQDLDCFHPHLDGITEVKQSLVPYLNRDGWFLVRISTSQEKTLTVSVTYANSIRHFKIQKKAHQYYLQDNLFNSIQALLLFYKTTDVPNVEKVKNVRLLHPIPKKPLPVVPVILDSTAARRGSNSSFGSHDRRDSVSSVGVVAPTIRESNVSVQRSGASHSSVSSVGSSFDEEDPILAYRRLFSSGRDEGKPPPGSGLDQAQQPQRIQSQRIVREKNETVRTRRIRSNDLQDRPPAPLPVDPVEDHSNGIYNGVYYSCVKRSEDTRLPQLLNTLSVDSSVTSSTMCECGLDLELSQLPQGWSVHVSREDDSAFGRPFFVSPSQVTTWDLSKDIYLELNGIQQKFIKFLCDNYDAGNPPPSEEAQRQFQNRASQYPSVAAADKGYKYTGRGLSQNKEPQSEKRSSQEGASSANRDSTGSNTGASHGAYNSRGVSALGTDSSESGAAI